LTRLAERRRGGVSGQIRLTLGLAVVGAKLAKVATLTEREGRDDPKRHPVPRAVVPR
jgi:hypothetical protein